MSSIPNVTPGLKQTPYFFEGQHALLPSDAWEERGPNIGRDGCNLTITFLSMNRSTLSEKLLRSMQVYIPTFSGEVLIIDNGSSQEELAYLHDVCKSMPFKVRIIELEKNHGVAGGRNRAIPHVHTEWMLCLDNDIYFIANPLPQFQKDLATLGCHFMSLPLLDADGQTIFSRGGHLSVSSQDGEVYIGAGSVGLPTVIQEKTGIPFLSTFLLGGACIVNKETFARMGGYDEGMFVGFEDIDFSIRLFQQGYKVGTAGSCALVHDHPKPASNSDRDYEKERFSRNLLFQSACHLEKKHGFKIWSEHVDTWLETRKQELQIASAQGNDIVQTKKYMTKYTDTKIKIALIIDTYNWAFGNISRQLQSHLSDEFSFVIIPMDVIDNIDQVFLLAKDCQIIHFFWREHLQLIGTPYYRSYIEEMGQAYAAFEERFIHSKILSTSVYDHLLLDPEALEERKALYTDIIAGYTVGSKKLNAIYENVPGYPRPTAIVEDGVDLGLFTPQNIGRFQDISQRDLVIGWVGNSKWAAELEDFKGVNTILKPAIEKLQSKGERVVSFFADRQERFIPHDEMQNYYKDIDVLVCTSKIEGTPNPVLEAMACGVPVISTDVGVVPQVFGILQKEFILKERSIDCLCDAIERLRRHPELLPQLSEENLKSIQDWDWSKQARKFGDYFHALLNKH